jgi:hypothetical protein
MIINTSLFLLAFIEQIDSLGVFVALTQLPRKNESAYNSAFESALKRFTPGIRGPLFRSGV